MDKEHADDPQELTFVRDIFVKDDIHEHPDLENKDCHDDGDYHNR
jgi:hypothetical protein